MNSVVRPLSVIEGRDSVVLQTLLDFYVRPVHGSRATILDVTCNKRKMWRKVVWKGKRTDMDVDPSMKPDVVGDFRDLPFKTKSFDVLVFDPPHIPKASASKRSDKGMVKNYGLAHAPKGSNISEYFAPFLKEAQRVLVHEGILFVKIKDFVHNHRYQWTLADFIAEVRKFPKLTACDLIVKRDPCGGNLKSGRWQKAHHVRNAHCWWVVVRRSHRCEAK